MLLALECALLCLVFTLIVIPPQYEDPFAYIMSYPPEIIRRTESLPQYQDKIKKDEKKHIVKKIAAVILAVFVLAAVAWFSGAKDFCSAFLHVFILFLSVNLYDVLVLDLGIFCHSKALRIPGTEDMDKEYKNPWFHIIGAGKGVLIGLGVALCSGGIVALAGSVLK